MCVYVYVCVCVCGGKGGVVVVKCLLELFQQKIIHFGRKMRLKAVNQKSDGFCLVGQLS